MAIKIRFLRLSQKLSKALSRESFRERRNLERASWKFLRSFFARKFLVKSKVLTNFSSVVKEARLRLELKDTISPSPFESSSSTATKKPNMDFAC